MATHDPQLCGTIVDNFLATLSTSCLYDTSAETSTTSSSSSSTSTSASNAHSRRRTATVQPYAIHCTLNVLCGVREAATELDARFADLFAVLLITLANYTHLAPPSAAALQTQNTNANAVAAVATATSAAPAARSKFGFGSNSTTSNNGNAANSTSGGGTQPAKPLQQPCEIVLATFRALLSNLDMEQLDAVLGICSARQLCDAGDLVHFIELLAPMAIGLVRQLGVRSRRFSQTVQALSRAVTSPYDAQRIAAVGLYAQLVPLLRPAAAKSADDATPAGDIEADDLTSLVMLHLNSGLTDPNALVRALCCRGLANVAQLDALAVTKYAELSLAALLRGVDDQTAGCVVNVPLESMLGLSRLLNALPRERLANFQVSLAIRIRPFFEMAASAEMREAAVLLFGDLCRAKDEETVETAMAAMRRQQQQQTNGGYIYVDVA